MGQQDHNTKWWGQFQIPENTGAEWQIEALKLAIHHVDKEWQVGYQRDSSDELFAGVPSFTRGNYELNQYDSMTRHVFTKSSSHVEIKPQLADRMVVTRPATPICLSPGEEVTLYISSPLWLQLEIGGKPGYILEDIAIQRLSDTWFGPSTRVGELCYASKTNGRINLDKLPVRPTRAITPLLVINEAADKLLLDRVALPVPHLTLYATPEGKLWTQAATLVREGDGDMAELKLAKHAPKEAVDAQPVNKARQQPEKGMLVRAFSSIF